MDIKQQLLPLLLQQSHQLMLLLERGFMPFTCHICLWFHEHPFNCARMDLNITLLTQSLHTSQPQAFTTPRGNQATHHPSTTTSIIIIRSPVSNISPPLLSLQQRRNPSGLFVQALNLAVCSAQVSPRRKEEEEQGQSVSVYG